MATLYSAHGAQNVDDQWCDADDGVQDTTPQAADDLIIHDVAADVTFNTDLIANSLSVTVGSLTLDGTRTFTGDLTLDGGTIVDAGNDLDFAGDLVFSSGTATTSGTWTQTDLGNVAWNTATQRLAHLVLGSFGTISTLTARTSIRKASTGPSTVTGGAILQVYPEANNSFVQDLSGTFSVAQLVLILQGDFSNNSIDVSDTSGGLSVQAQSVDRTFLMTGDIDCGTKTLQVGAATDTKTGTLDMDNQRLTVGDVMLGEANANDRSGSLLLVGASHKITGTLQSGNAANNNNALSLASSYIEASGTLDFDNIAVTATAGACHIEGVGVGDLDNATADPGALVHCHNLTETDGDAHANYTFDQHTPPNSLALMGAGI